MKIDDLLIGTVKGPGTGTNEYFFITHDNHKSKIGEFVYYTTQEDNKIIGTIKEKTLIKGLPDSFMADPSVSPEDIASLIGFKTEISELFQITVTINGYFDKELNSFINPRIPPDPGNRIYLVSDQDLTEIINSRQEGEIGSINIGSLLSRKTNQVPVLLNVKNMVSTHLAILASTGSGKSYTAGVLIEELLKSYNRAAVLIIDPHNEYNTLKSIEINPLFKDNSYQPEVHILPPDKIKVRISSLSEYDIRYLLPELTDKMQYTLSQAYKNTLKQLKKGDEYLWGLSDLKRQIEDLADEKSSNEGTINALLWRINSRLEHSKVFHDSEHIPLNKLFKPGQCTVFQLSEIDQKEQQVIVSTILRRIYKARMDTIKENIKDHYDESYIPYPVFIMIEEAHRFAPANADAVSTSILKTILSEGRKFGVGIGLITQRPGKIDSDILSQCMTQMIMKIINPIDQSSIASSVESAGSQLFKELPSLTKGQVIISGPAVNLPVMCKVRERITKHGGETLDAPAEWMNYFDENKAYTRKIEASTYIKRDSSEKYKGYSI